MANAIKREIQEGEKIVLKKGVLRSDLDTPENRIVTANDGFGMVTFTRGTALFVTFYDGEKGRIDAINDVDVKKTEKLGSAS